MPSKKREPNTILINIMYAGNYINKNIGHEIINLYKTDKGENYIYISPHGKIDKNKYQNIKTVLLARGAGKRKIEIIAKADISHNEDIKDYLNPLILHEQYKKVSTNLKQNENKFIHEKHNEAIIKYEIKYDNVELNKIFAKNEGNETAAYLTFKASNVYKPDKPLYFSYKGNSQNELAEFISSNDNNFSFQYLCIKNQKCIKYLSEKDMKKGDFDKFIKALNKQFENKIEATTTLEESQYKGQTQSFLDITGKQYDELAYSNMFAYFFEKDEQLFNNFAKIVLEVADVTTKITYEVKREENKIDLLINTDNHVFVIENKIKSKINGEKYDFYNEKYQNQLTKYYNSVKKDEKYKNKNCTFYIFTPDYNKININELQSKCGKDTNSSKIIGKYKIKKYSELLKFFKQNPSKDTIHYKAFCDSLERHTKNIDNSIEETMEYKFRQAINNGK